MFSFEHKVLTLSYEDGMDRREPDLWVVFQKRRVRKVISTKIAVEDVTVNKVTQKEEEEREALNHQYLRMDRERRGCRRRRRLRKINWRAGRKAKIEEYHQNQDSFKEEKPLISYWTLEFYDPRRNCDSRFWRDWYNWNRTGKLQRSLEVNA